ncbi:hypothetical protein HanPSC8_Chr10g0413781 [Helianthus annuus]|nr:hypothetical protein HanPSC8_Chr10g0413781 [Helianthus annuus]
MHNMVVEGSSSVGSMNTVRTLVQQLQQGIIQRYGCTYWRPHLESWLEQVSTHWSNFK